MPRRKLTRSEVLKNRKSDIFITRRGDDHCLICNYTFTNDILWSDHKDTNKHRNARQKLLDELDYESSDSDEDESSDEYESSDEEEPPTKKRKINYDYYHKPQYVNNYANTSNTNTNRPITQIPSRSRTSRSRLYNALNLQPNPSNISHNITNPSAVTSNVNTNRAQLNNGTMTSRPQVNNDGSVCWSWQHNDSWKRYDSATITQIENAYNEFKSYVALNQGPYFGASNRQGRYMIQFNRQSIPHSFTQVNSSTLFKRKVARTGKNNKVSNEEKKQSKITIDNDHSGVKVAFFSTLSPSEYEITDIQNISNLNTVTIYESILDTKCKKANLKPSQMEQFLWHGIKGKDCNDILEKILKNGFDRSYNKVGIFGRGTYFARDAKYSVKYEYCGKDSNDIYFILFCRVFIGHYANGKQDMNTIPTKPNGEEYDSLVDNKDNPSIFVSWRDYHAIPYYLVKFKKK